MKSINQTIKSSIYCVSLVALLVSCGGKSEKETPKTNNSEAIENAPTEVKKEVDLSKVDQQLLAAYNMIGSPVNNAEQEEQTHNFGSCITGTAPSIEVLNKKPSDDRFAPDGQKINFLHKKIESKYELRQLLKVETGVSGFYNGATAKANSDYFRDVKITEDEKYFFYKIEVSNPAVTMKDIKLTDEAVELIKEKGLEGFYRRCGKQAVIGYRTGGFLYSVLKISKKDKTSSVKVDSLISASGFGFDVDGKITSSKDLSKSELDFSVFARWEGGLGQKAHTDLTKLRLMSETWPQTVSKHAVVTELVTVPYKNLVSSIRDEDFENIQNELSLYYFQLDRLSNIKSIIVKDTHYKGYATKDIGTESIYKLDNLIEALSEKIKSCKKALTFEACQDTELLLDARDYRIALLKEHRSCGIKSYVLEKVRAAQCGVEKYSVSTRKAHSSCGVKSFKTGLIFSGTSIEGRIPSVCKRASKKEVTSCHRSSTRIGGVMDHGLMTCKIKCWAPAKKFGVQEYNTCSVRETRSRFKECLVPTTKVKEYKTCLVEVD